MRIIVEDTQHPDRVTHATGYAEIHRQLILTLDSLGEQVFFPPCTEALAGASLLDEEVRRRLQELNRRTWTDDADTVFLQVSSPDTFVVRPGRFSAGLTMTERESLAGYADRFDWVRLCNSLDLILTPSPWCRSVFEQHGIRNVVITPLGVDHAFFSPASVGFLSVLSGFGLRGSRANWQDLVTSFRDEFRGERDVRLTILSHGLRKPFSYSSPGEAARTMPQDLAAAVRELWAGPSPPVDVREGGKLRREELRGIYRDHDCLLSYSREGWGFPALEAMGCGLDLIACAYGSPLSYLEGSPALLFAPGRLSADNLKFEGGDLATLRRHMRSVYDARRRTRRWAIQFDWIKAVAHIRDVLRERHAAWRRTRP